MPRQLDRCTLFALALVAATSLASGCDATPDATQSISQSIEGGQPEPNYPAVGNVVTDKGDCTGVLIAPSYAITAENCNVTLANDLVFQTGTGPANFVSHPVDSFLVDPNTQTLLMHLAQPIWNIEPMTLNLVSLPAVGTTCTAVGFGAYVDPSTHARTGGNKRSCTEIVQTANADIITVGTGTGIEDKGDPGGPLVCNGAVVALDFGNGTSTWPNYTTAEYTTIPGTFLLSNTWLPNSPNINAAVTADGVTHVRWVGGVRPTTGWTIESSNGHSTTVTADPLQPNSFVGTVVSSLHDTIQVCVPTLGNTYCLGVTPADATQTAVRFAMALTDAENTGWGAPVGWPAITSGVSTLGWAQASRIAYGFCSSLGFTGGQLAGTTSKDKTNVGVDCYGGNAIFTNTTSANAGSAVTQWGFANIDTVNWAQAARASSDICQKYGSGTYGLFDGNHSGSGTSAQDGLVCWQSYSMWFDAPLAQLAAYEPTVKTPLDGVAWDAAARAASAWCQAQSYSSGRLTGYSTSTTARVICVEPPPCVPLTCAAVGAACGTANDQCGGTLNCGTCSTGNSCSANHCCPTGQEWDGLECTTVLKCRAGFSDCGGYCCKCGRSNCS